MHSKAKNQAAGAVYLRRKFDYISESWYRVDRAIRSGEIHSIEPEFKVGRRRVYRRDNLDRELSLRKFGPERLPEARQHRTSLFPLVAPHLAPVEPTMPPPPFERAWVVGWAEHKALARLNKPPKKKHLGTAPPLQWVLEYSVDDDGGFKLTGSMARVKKENNSDTI